MLNQIEKALYETYGTSILAADPTTIIWAAERCTDPKAALKAANRKRQQMGRPLAYAPYGSAAF